MKNYVYVTYIYKFYKNIKSICVCIHKSTTRSGKWHELLLSNPMYNSSVCVLWSRAVRISIFSLRRKKLGFMYKPNIESCLSLVSILFIRQNFNRLWTVQSWESLLMFASYFAKRSLGVSKAGECRKLTRWEGLLIEFWASSLWRGELPSVLRENDPCSLKQNKTKKSLWSLSRTQWVLRDRVLMLLPSSRKQSHQDWSVCK